MKHDEERANKENALGDTREAEVSDLSCFHREG